MKFLSKKQLFASVVSVSLFATITTSNVLADGHSDANVTVYITRHAEKQNELDDKENSFCKDDLSRCAEELSALGKLRAEFLAVWLEEEGILEKITKVISSDKQRTRQTIEPTAARIIELGKVDLLSVDSADTIADGVTQVPASKANTEGNEIKGNSGSVDPTVEAIKALEPGSVALVAAHSGTIYRIMGGQDTDGNPSTGKDGDNSVGLGIDTTQGDNFADVTMFPKKESDGKVPTFGDVWKVVINHESGEAVVEWRKNLQPTGFSVANESAK